jgi:hypothetical protein
MTGASGVTVLLPSVTTAWLTSVPSAVAVAATGTVISTLSDAPQLGPRLQLKLLPVVVQAAGNNKITTKSNKVRCDVQNKRCRWKESEVGCGRSSAPHALIVAARCAY